MSFDKAFAATVGLEGGYSDDPNDRGGKTKFGITERVARANGYKDDMKDMPLSVAQVIYRNQYWDLLKLDDVCVISSEVAHKLFDQAVNMGVGVAGTFLQRALNVLNRGGADYGDLTVDGVVGPVTVSHLIHLNKVRGDRGMKVLYKVLNGLQVARYVEIAEKNPSQEVFEFGWLNNRTT